jgi:hypothetical protein
MFSFFKRRDATIYPKDEIGDALYEQFPNPKKLPAKVAIWYDVYFKREIDADRLASHLENRKIQIVRDYDREPGENLGPWSIDFEIPVKARHLDMMMTHAETKRMIKSFDGQVPSWHVSQYEEN